VCGVGNWDTTGNGAVQADIDVAATVSFFGIVPKQDCLALDPVDGMGA
jgi:hypothetical protein